MLVARPGAWYSNAATCALRQHDDGVASRRLSARDLSGSVPVLLALVQGRRHERGGRDRRNRGERGEAQRSVGDRNHADPCGEREAADRHRQRLPGIHRENDAGREHGHERHGDEARHEHGLPALGLVRTPSEAHESPGRKDDDHRAPADCPTQTGSDVFELEGTGTVERVRPVGGRRHEEEPAFDRCDAGRGNREPQVDVAARDDERDELRGDGTCGNRMGERERSRAHDVERPPDRVAALDGPREECARDEHRGERER